MPRNASGSFTLVAGNPVVSDTVIETNWANPTLADIAQALTDSLDRYGRGSMVGSMRFPDGTMAAPSIAFSAESSTGLFRPTSRALAASVNNNEVMRLEPDRVTLKASSGDILTAEPTQITFTAPPFWATDPTADEHLTNKAFVETHVAEYVDEKLSTGAPGGGYLPLLGGTLAGDLYLNYSANNVQTVLMNPTAPANHKTLYFRQQSNGNAILAKANDALTGWTGGLEIRSSGKMHDIVTGAELMTTQGGPLTGNLAVTRSPWGTISITVPAAPDQARSALMYHTDLGHTYFGHWNGAQNAVTGGILIDSNNILFDQKTGGRIWHERNDGTGSGLDADLLEGFHGASASSPYTYALRDGGSYVVCNGVIANNVPRVWANFNGKTNAVVNSFSVTSVTDQGTGRSRLNFGSALLNKDYCAVVTAGDNSYLVDDYVHTAQIRWDTRTASSCDIYCYRATDTGVSAFELSEVNFVALNWGT